MGQAFITRLEGGIMRKLITFLKWRIIFTRYLMKLINNDFKDLIFGQNVEPSSLVCSEIKKTGFFIKSPIAPELVSSINAMVKGRVSGDFVKKQGAPFVNLIKEGDIRPDNPVFQLAFSNSILDAAIDYFSGSPSLDSIQLLYSCSGGGEPRESQLWHKDYGDYKSLHAIIYLNDVLDEDSGPFVYIDKEASKKIKKYPVVRRINDNDFFQELKDGEVTFFYGKAGSFVLVDPAACYHHGSRGRKPRLALFVTFNTSTPYVKAQDFIIKNKESIIDCCLKLRPDLSKEFVGKMVG